jgi:hypothetical protein
MAVLLAPAARRALGFVVGVVFTSLAVDTCSGAVRRALLSPLAGGGLFVAQTVARSVPTEKLRVRLRLVHTTVSC